MPRVSDAHRQARRDQIADAALRVLKRNGLSDTSIAEIAEECGLSIGAIYVNFENKQALARYLGSRLFAWRIEGLEAMAADGRVHPPAELMQPLLASMSEATRPPLPIILQFWSKAVVDEDLHEVLVEQVGTLRASLERALRPWADATAAGAGAPGDGAALAARTASACLIMGQGFLANRCLLGWMSAEDYLETVTVALGSTVAAAV
jgi:AcrR family transcriptional regulator